MGSDRWYDDALDTIKSKISLHSLQRMLSQDKESSQSVMVAFSTVLERLRSGERNMTFRRDSHLY